MLKLKITEIGIKQILRERNCFEKKNYNHNNN